MSKKAVYNLLTRAFLDPGFRQELERDASASARRLGMDLTPEEEGEVRRALVEEGGVSATGLDKRISKSGVSLSPQAMLRQKGDGGKAELRVESLRREVRRQMAGLRLGPGQDDKVLMVEDRGESSAPGDGEQSMDEPDYEVERG